MNMGTTRTISGEVITDIVEVERAVVREEEFMFTMMTKDGGYWEVYMDEDKNFYGFYVDYDEVEE
jgi:hypothetical protein